MNPGSPDAVQAGCTCSVDENDHGRSPTPWGWAVDLRCPVHGFAAPADGQADGGGQG